MIRDRCDEMNREEMRWDGTGRDGTGSDAKAEVCLQGSSRKLTCFSVSIHGFAFTRLFTDACASFNCFVDWVGKVVQNRREGFYYCVKAPSVGCKRCVHNRPRAANGKQTKSDLHPFLLLQLVVQLPHQHFYNPRLRTTHKHPPYTQHTLDTQSTHTLSIIDHITSRTSLSHCFNLWSNLRASKAAFSASLTYPARWVDNSCDGEMLLVKCCW
jgi:hypothetical protein